MDGGAAQSVTISFNRVETGFQELLLHIFGKLPESDGSRIGKGSSETINGLKGLVVVNHDCRIIFVRLFKRFKSPESLITQ